MVLQVASMVGVLLPLAMIVLGLLFAIFGIATMQRERRRQREWLRVPGEAYDYVWSGGENSTQHWMIRWTGPDGVERRRRNPYGVSGGSLRSFPFPVEVLVDPNDPDRAQVASGHTGTAVAVAFSVFGVIALLAGLGILVARLS